MVYIRKMKGLLADPRLGLNCALEPLDKVIADAEVVLDTDALLAASNGSGSQCAGAIGFHHWHAAGSA